MFWSQLIEVCEDILVNRNQMFHCSLERDDNQRQACTSKRCSIIKTCRRSAKLNTLIIKDQSDGWNVSPPSFKVSKLSLELWPGEVRLQTSRAPESLQDNKDFRWEPVSEYEMQNFAMLTGYSGRIVVNYLLHLFFFAQFHHLLWSEVDTNSIQFHKAQTSGGIISLQTFAKIWLAERSQQGEISSLHQSGLLTLATLLYESFHRQILNCDNTELRNPSLSWTYKAYLGTQRRAWRFIDTDYGRL